MREIEVKILEINQKRLIEKLKKMGARKVFSGTIEAFYFDDRRKSLAQQGKILRLRRKGDEVELAVKKLRSRKKAKIMDEYEVCLKDFAAMRQILIQLGYRVMRHYRKRRTSFVYRDCHFEIDVYPKIPAYLEIETTSLVRLQAMLRRLGYKREDAKPWSAFELLQHYKR